MASADRPSIAVVGPGVASPVHERAAEEVGRRLAERGAVVVCGGMTGVMQAVCRGAHAAGGTTVGILPGRERADANPYVDVAVPTGMGEMRNALVVRSAQAVIAVAGEYGTLSEIALALKIGVPVVGLSTWELVRPDGERDEGIRRAGHPAEAVELALELAGATRRVGRESPYA